MRQEDDKMYFGKFQEVADYVQTVMSVDDFTHTVRVFNYALQILDTEKKAEADITLLAALLHDIGRTSGRVKGHDKIGSKKSHTYLIQKGYPEEIAMAVADCISTHSHDSEAAPQTLEAKILFDADKLDTLGATGAISAIAEALKERMPLYVIDENYLPAKGTTASLLRKYKEELKYPKVSLFTKQAKKIAQGHQKAMDSYFKKLTKEIEQNRKKATKAAKKFLSGE
jgi:uncharacterized protein